MPFDFSAVKYRQLCESLVTAGYRSIKFTDYVAKSKKADRKKRVLLRHDVDRFAKSALHIAEIEQDLGLCASYYFRIPGTFKPEIIKQIHALGHEVGLHYEVLDKSRGDIAMAAQFLKEDLARLRDIAPVEIASMHGNPLTPFNNLDIWQHFIIDNYGILGEAYLSVDISTLLYFSDTGRTWKKNKFNIYDHMQTKAVELSEIPIAESTDDLIEIICHSDRNIYILTHPERWPTSFASWLLSWSLDAIANPLKLVFQFAYHYGRGRTHG